MVDFLQILQNYRVYVYYMYLKIKCFAIVVFTPKNPQVSLLNCFTAHIYSLHWYLPWWFETYFQSAQNKLFNFYQLYSLFGVWFLGMNSSVRAVVRMGSYLGCKVFYIKEVRDYTCQICRNFKRFVCSQNYVPVHVWFTCTFMNLEIMEIRRKYR